MCPRGTCHRSTKSNRRASGCKPGETTTRSLLKIPGGLNWVGSKPIWRCTRDWAEMCSLDQGYITPEYCSTHNSKCVQKNIACHLHPGISVILGLFFTSGVLGVWCIIMLWNKLHTAFFRQVSQLWLTGNVHWTWNYPRIRQYRYFFFKILQA